MIFNSRIVRLCIVWLSIYSIPARADFKSIQKCVDEKYQTLTNRRGIVAAVVDTNSTEFLTFGQAKVDQIFEIGSITKTFTGNLLAQRVVEGNLKLSDAIPNEYQKDEHVPITYQHLLTHTSGIISGNFPGFVVPNPQSPYEGLTIPLFKDFYSRTPFMPNAKPGAQWAYSNIATGLLGTILAESEKTSYERLVADRIFSKLGMNDSYFQVPESEKHRFPKGNVDGQVWSHCDLYDTAIDPAGGIRSTISDMARYARANLVPSSTDLETAISMSHQPLYYIDDHKMWIGMNWILEPEKNLIWHNGSTIAFNSILAISTKYNVAVVALTDTGVINTDQNGNSSADKSLQEVAFACLQ
jgi:CubicO group peptidase (beta-lactamase class C family)